MPGRGNMEISNTLMVVLNKLGIECCKVFGKFDYFLDIKPHIWNIVKINGEWKHFDLTNDLEKDEGNWMWFNVSNDDMLQKTVVGLNTKRFFIVKNEIVREFLRSVKNNFCYVESYAQHIICPTHGPNESSPFDFAQYNMVLPDGIGYC